MGKRVFYFNKGDERHLESSLHLFLETCLDDDANFKESYVISIEINKISDETKEIDKE